MLIFNHERSFRGRREGYLLFYDLLFTIYFALLEGIYGTGRGFIHVDFNLGKSMGKGRNETKMGG